MAVKIFLSYSSYDNDEGVYKTGIQFISKMKELLIQQLRLRGLKYLGDTISSAEADFDIFLDQERMDSNPKITETLDAAVKSSDIMMVFLTPCYLNSSWCDFELKTFAKNNKPKTNDHNIFTIQPLYKFQEGKEKPKEPHGTEKPKELHDTRSFYLQEQSVDDDIFLHFVSDVAKAVYKYIKNLPQDQPEEIQEKIFLSEVPRDLDTERETVRDYLEGLGYDIYPKTKLPPEASAFKEAVSTDLQECKLFVQLLNATVSEKPSDLPKGYVATQHEIASKHQIPILQWCDTSIELPTIKDVDYNDSLIHGSLDVFKKEIINTLKQFKEEEERNRRLKPLRHTKDFEDVFIHTTSQDGDVLQQIKQTLKNDFEVSELIVNKGSSNVNVSENQLSAKEMRERYEWFILNCHHYILIIGHTDIGWINGELFKYKQKIKLQRANDPKYAPIRSILIYKAPPKNDKYIEGSFPYLHEFDGEENEAFDQVYQLLMKGGISDV
jgi:hypothetical protein